MLQDQPPTGNDFQSLIEFLNQRKKKKSAASELPEQMSGTSPNASLYGGSSLMSPAMKAVLGQ